MLRLALFFLVVSLVAALFGFTGISAACSDTVWIWLMSIGPYGQNLSLIHI